MKTTDAKEKKFRQLSDEELEKVTGGAGIDCSLPENKDKIQCLDKFKVQGVTWGPNPVDSQVITAIKGQERALAVIE